MKKFISLLIPSFRTPSSPYHHRSVPLENLWRSETHCNPVTQKIWPQYRPPCSISGTKIRCPIRLLTPLASQYRSGIGLIRHVCFEWARCLRPCHHCSNWNWMSFMIWSGAMLRTESVNRQANYHLFVIFWPKRQPRVRIAWSIFRLHCGSVHLPFRLIFFIPGTACSKVSPFAQILIFLTDWDHHNPHLKKP